MSSHKGPMHMITKKSTELSQNRESLSAKGVNLKAITDASEDYQSACSHFRGDKSTQSGLSRGENKKVFSIRVEPWILEKNNII